METTTPLLGVISSAGHWVVQSFDFTHLSVLVCTVCDQRVEFNRFIQRLPLTPRCRCDEEKDEERAWRKHFGVLTELWSSELTVAQG